MASSVAALGVIVAGAGLVLAVRLMRRGALPPPPTNPWGLPDTEYHALMDRVMTLREKDPVEAERVLKEALGPAIQAKDDARAALWAQASSNPAIAKELHDELLEELETDKYALREMKDSAPHVVNSVRESMAKTEQDIRKVRAWMTPAP